MTAAALGSPGGRVLAGWWRQLAPHSPRALWLADWELHRVEVLTRRLDVSPLDSLPRSLLDLLSDRVLSTAALSQRTGLDSPLLRRWLRELCAEGFLESPTEDRWTPTAAGRAAAHSGTMTRPIYQRQPFCVLDSPPAVLPLTVPGLPFAPPDDWQPPLDALRTSLTRSAEWKQRVGFPPEIDAVLGVDEETGEVPAWRRVPLDRPERLVTALIHAADRLLAFAVKPDAWTLSAEPIMQLQIDDAVELLDLTEPEPATWHAAWHEWCRTVRGAAPEEVEAAELTRVEERLHVAVAPALLEKLKLGRAEAFRGEAWLLAGPVRCRTAVRLQFAD